MDFMAPPRSQRCAFGHPPAEASEGHQREVMGVHVVAEVEMVGEAGTCELRLVPIAGIPLAFHEPGHAAHNAVTEFIFTGNQSDNRPCALRACARSAALVREVRVAEAALAPSAVAVLHRLEPSRRALDPRLVCIAADRTQSGQRREVAVDITDAPPAT